MEPVGNRNLIGAPAELLERMVVCWVKSTEPRLAADPPTLMFPPKVVVAVALMIDVTISFLKFPLEAETSLAITVAP